MARKSTNPLVGVTCNITIVIIGKEALKVGIASCGLFVGLWGIFLIF